MEKDPKEPLKKLVHLIKDHALLFALLIYASGFFVWNFYLSSFGFFEYNLVQIRYLSAGLIIWIPIFILACLIYRSNERFGKYSVILTGFIWIIIIVNFFPNIPQYLGGAKPIPASIIGSPDQIDFLINFGIMSAENSEGKKSVQTYPVCLIYQNDRYSLFFTATNFSTSTDEKGNNNLSFIMRVLSISKDNFIGFQSMSGKYDKLQCNVTGALYNGVVLIPS